MAIDVSLLSPADDEEYESVLQSNEHALLYTCIKYRNMLRQFVGAEDCYLVARCQGRIVGLLPAFLKRTSLYGNVLNSLPFYGSNGGVVCEDSLADRRAVKRRLLDAFYQLAEDNDVVSSTIITSPFETDIDIYEESAGGDYSDGRIGQVTTFTSARCVP